VTPNNAWVALYTLVTGRTVGGLLLTADAECLDRIEALGCESRRSTLQR
jgi:hypothetical protein